MVNDTIDTEHVNGQESQSHKWDSCRTKGYIYDIYIYIYINTYTSIYICIYNEHQGFSFCRGNAIEHQERVGVELGDWEICVTFWCHWQRIVAGTLNKVLRPNLSLTTLLKIQRRVVVFAGLPFF